jgi:diphosphoinositol-polyphosphate diphosphatase
MTDVLDSRVSAPINSFHDGKRLAARVGREHQRYGTDGTRLVAGCVPYRISSTGCVEVLLITNRKQTHWIIPKGGWEVDESASEAAARETYEEAGVVGHVGALLYQFDHVGKKGSKQEHHYFAMLVQQEIDVFPEAGERQRQWLPVAEAQALCVRTGMHDAILALQRRHAEGASLTA